MHSTVLHLSTQQVSEFLHELNYTKATGIYGIGPKDFQVKFCPDFQLLVSFCQI